MIDVSLSGDTDLVAKLGAIPARLQAQLEERLNSLALQLQGSIKQKLSGAVLKVRSGNLRDSIAYNVVSKTNSVTATVFSDGSVKYDKIQEYGGTTSPHVIEPRNAKALHFKIGLSGGAETFIFARRVNHPGSRIPSRPFMRPTLAEYRQTIIDSLNQAAQESIA